MAVSNNTKIVFIIGAPRSGTTWLQLILYQSPSVAAAQETHLFSQYLRSLFASWQTYSADNRGTGLSTLLSEEQFFSWISEFAGTCLGEIGSKRPGANIVVEKTPDHARSAAAILKIYPRCYFIHVIRDPRGVIGSLRAASAGWGQRWASRRLKDACTIWRDSLAFAQAIPSLTPRYTEVFYERLHADGPGELMRLFEWLGEPIELAEAEKYVAACAIDKLRSGDADAPWDLKTEPAAFFRRGEIDSWRGDLSPSDIAIVERATKKQMKRLGYEPVSGGRARIIASLRLRAYRTANAFALGARSFADRVKP